MHKRLCYAIIARLAETTTPLKMLAPETEKQQWRKELATVNMSVHS